jgi:hypothetical protein
MSKPKKVYYQALDFLNDNIDSIELVTFDIRKPPGTEMAKKICAKLKNSPNITKLCFEHLNTGYFPIFEELKNAR